MRPSYENSVVELSANWQIFYLPSYVAVFREIEAEISLALDKMGFQECLFPKLIDDQQFRDLQACIPRFQTEWSDESLTTDRGPTSDPEERGLRLCHWQCEPFYLYLQRIRPTRSQRFYDRSGWSFRREVSLDRNRLLAFQRLEVTFFLHRDEAQTVLESVLSAVWDAVARRDISTRLVVQEDEMRSTGEALVKDLEGLDNDGRWIEIAGGHLHDRLLLDGLDIGVPPSFVTGCCGIGMSRITNLVLSGVSPGGDRPPGGQAPKR